MTPVTATNILRHETIGLEVKVSGDSNDYCKNINGELIEERETQLLFSIKENLKLLQRKTRHLCST